MNSVRNGYKWRRWIRLLALTAPGALFLSSLGCVSVETVSPRQTVPPPSVAVSKNQAWKDAEALAAMDPSRLTVIGSGESMKPVYGENTVLVLQRVRFESLSEGMNVAYRNHEGRVVLHCLVERETSRAWRVRGLNNENEDDERVTPENLLGIVYAAFANDAVR